MGNMAWRVDMLSDAERSCLRRTLPRPLLRKQIDSRVAAAMSHEFGVSLRRQSERIPRRCIEHGEISEHGTPTGFETIAQEMIDIPFYPESPRQFGDSKLSWSSLRASKCFSKILAEILLGLSAGMFRRRIRRSFKHYRSANGVHGNDEQTEGFRCGIDRPRSVL